MEEKQRLQDLFDALIVLDLALENFEYEVDSPEHERLARMESILRHDGGYFKNLYRQVEYAEEEPEVPSEVDA